jgi:hypothetical protein
MPDENNPTIYIEYSDEAFPPSSWESLKEYALDFKVTNSGIFRTPLAELILKNTSGRYTGNGSLTLEPHKLLRIRADVRGTIDTLFYGRIANLESSSKRKKAEKLTITARGMTQKLLQDTIDKQYLDEQEQEAEDRTMKQVIEDLLTTPDSGFSTGITLVTDSGDITTVKAKHNFDRTTLLDAIKKICEYIGYVGYEEVSGSNINLHLYPYGWQATNPAITIPANEEDRKNILERDFSRSLDELYNHIFVWADVIKYFPNLDKFTENAVENGYWTANNDETTVTDENGDRINNKWVKIAKLTGIIPHTDAILDLTSLFPDGLDIDNKHLTALVFDYYVYEPQGDINITLYDTNDDFITWHGLAHGACCDNEWWYIYDIPLGKDHHLTTTPNMTEYTVFIGAGQNVWHIPQNGSFNWIIKKIRFRQYVHAYQGKAFTTRIDGLHFEGSIPVNPIENPELTASDQTSINNYGRRIMHQPELTLKDYTLIHTFAEKILETTKNPLYKLTLKYGAKTWIKPNQYVTVNIPVYAISNEQWRIVEFLHEWSTNTKLLRTTFQLTPRYQPVRSSEWYAGLIVGIIKSMLW